MPCNCGTKSARSKRLTVKATKRATKLAVKGVKIKPAQPKKTPAKKVPPKKVKPCNCT